MSRPIDIRRARGAFLGLGIADALCSHPNLENLDPSNLNQLLTTPNHLSLTSNTTMSITLAEHLLSNQGKIEIKTLTDAFQAALVQSPTRT